MQCTLESKGDHILAARFLSRFVPASIPWVHVDLSSSERKGGLAHVPTEFTGFGVRLASRLLGEGDIFARLENRD
jgi:leucyl aminopeptidase/proline iminopeptidase